MLNINSSEKKLCCGDGIIIALTLFICTFFVYKDFGIRMRYGWAALILATLFSVALSIRQNKGWSHFDIRNDLLKPTFMFLTVVVFLLFIRPDSRHDEDTISHIIAMIITLFMVLFANPSDKEIVISKKILIFTALFYSLLILFFKFFPALYWDSLFKMISVPSQELALRYIPRGYGIPLGGSYYLADYVIIAGLIVVFVDLQSNLSKKTKIRMILLSLFLIIGVFVVGRRGELVAAIITLSFLFLLPTKAHFSKRKIYTLIGLCVICVVILILTYPLIKNIPSFHRYIRSIEGILSGKDISSGRFELWRQALDLFKSNPLFGIGFGGFASHISDPFRAVHGKDVMNVHNLLLQFLSETGIVGTLLFFVPLLGTFGIVLRRFIKDIRSGIASSNMEKAIQFAKISLGIQIFFLVLNMFDPSFYKLIFWSFYGLALMFGIKSFTLSKIARKEVDEFSAHPEETTGG